MVEVYLCLTRDICITDLDMDRMDVQGYDIFMLFAMDRQLYNIMMLFIELNEDGEGFAVGPGPRYLFATFISFFSRTCAASALFTVHSNLHHTCPLYT